MRLLILRVSFLLCLGLLVKGGNAQSFSFNCTKDTLVPGCPANLCITLKSIIPDIKGLSDSYTLNPGSNVPGCFPVYVAPNDPAGTPTNLTIDDRYSSVINIGFPFSFYGTVYNSLLASTNGYLCFDISKAGLFSHYQNFGDLPNTQYDPALIMGPYHDLDPSQNTSPTRKIQYQVFGVAPHRRWILSFYRVPLFQCTSLIENTHQIILYESTGIIEVKIFDKQICSSWQGGKAMVGIQDFSRTQGMMAPLRKMSDPAWGSIGMNETWRFVPNSGPSLFKRVELYDLGNNLIATGSTTSLGNGQLEASFPNICAPAGATTTYIVKSVYQKNDDPSVEIFGTDTIRVNRLVALTGTATATPASCGTANGTITITGVTGGTPPYEYSLDGVTWQSSNVFTGLTAGNYTIHIRDAGSVCTTTIPVLVPVSGNISATTSVTASSCVGVNNGSITVSSAGGTGPYYFSLDGGPLIPGSLPFTFTNLAPGNHTILINDQGTGCSTGMLAIYVPAGAGVTGNAIPTSTTCPLVSNGTITATAFTGTAPFTFQLDGGPIQSGSNPYTFTNVAAGPHSVTIRDNIGCSIIINVTVNTGSGINANISTTATACTGISNGTITINATTGTPPYTFKLDAGAPQSGSNPYTFTNVSAGSHTITVTDAVGCSLVSVVNVAVGPGVSANITSTATSCTGVSNGTITANATTGTAPFTFQLDGGPIQSGSNPYTFSNVAAGPHTVTITDNVGCTITGNVIVQVGTGISANISATPTACSGVANGTITVNATTGTAPYTYQLDAGAPQSGSNPYTFTNVAAGPHTVVVTDNLGCSVTGNVTVIIGSGVNANLSSTAASCQVSPDGTITADAITGSAPFTYQLDGGALQNGSNPYTFINVTPGSHTVTITDNFGCTYTNTVTVAPGPPLTANLTSSATSCNGASNGTITVNPTSGTAPYTYSLDGGTPVAGTAPYTFTNVSAGPHTVVINDASGCFSNLLNIVVAVGPPLTTTISKTDVLCYGGATGSITVTVPSIGTPPYQYSLDGINWQAGNVFNGLIAGNYTVYYRESNGCQGSQTVVINQPAAALAANSTMVPVICNGQSNGIITVNAAGGTAPYQYSLDGGAYQGNNVFNSNAGLHSISIKDANGCITTTTITVTEPAALTASTVVQNASCDGGNDGVITITAAGGNSGYQYSLDGANFKTEDSFHVAPGNYVVTIKDNLGCTTTRNVTVGLNTNLTLTPQADQTICEGTSAQLQLISNATQYAWSPATGLSSTSISNPIANPTVTTQYIVSAILGRCAANDTVIVYVNAAPVPNAGPDGFICYGQTYQLQASGGTTFHWTPSTYLSNTAIANPVSSPSQTIIYTLSVIDANGCRSLVTDDVKVDVTPPIKVDVYPRDTILYSGEQVQLQASSIGNIYNWSPATGLSNPNISNPVVTAGPMGSVVLYTVMASTAAGCQGTANVKVQVYKGPDIYMPTAFTPNGDGKNDLFRPFNVGIEKLNYFKIFNRWGQQIFSTSVMNEGWNGKVGGIDQPTGVYVWMVQGITKEGKVITKKGTITLIR
jgi:gliding motility-associated-like protein